MQESEFTAPGFEWRGLADAREQSWKALQLIAREIKVGMNEVQAAKLASNILKDLGSTRFWHKPIIRFGSNTCKTFSVPLSEKTCVVEGDAFFIDIGPVWTFAGSPLSEYEGDVGDTFVLGTDPEKSDCILAARELFCAAIHQWKSKALSGSTLYAWMAEQAAHRGYDLLMEVDGHRISDFPHRKTSALALADVTHSPAGGLWVLEVHVVDRKRQFGAFFEDILM